MAQSKTQKRRPRADTAQAKTEALRAADRTIAPPAHVRLNEQGLIHFYDAAEEFAKSELTPHKISMVAILAGNMADVDEQSRLLSQEGLVITQPSGRIAANPRIGIITALQGTILALRRSLGIHCRGEHGDSRSAAKRRSLAKGYEDDAPDEDDALINKPKLH
jgi:hypothetical protein